jgi:hypothetical protein
MIRGALLLAVCKSLLFQDFHIPEEAAKTQAAAIGKDHFPQFHPAPDLKAPLLVRLEGPAGGTFQVPVLVIPAGKDQIGEGLASHKADPAAEFHQVSVIDKFSPGAGYGSRAGSPGRGLAGCPRFIPLAQGESRRGKKQGAEG